MYEKNCLFFAILLMTQGNLFANLWTEPLSLGKDPSSEDISLQSAQEDIRALKVDPSGIKGRFSIGGKAIEAAKGVVEKINKGNIDEITKEDLQYFLICFSFLLKVQEDNKYVENKNVQYSPQKGMIRAYTRNNEPLTIEAEAILHSYHQLKEVSYG